MNEIEYKTLKNLLKVRNYDTRSHWVSGCIFGSKIFSDNIVAEISICDGDIHSWVSIRYDPKFRSIEDIKEIDKAEAEVKEDVLYLEKNKNNVTKEDIKDMLEDRILDPALIEIIMERLK